MGRGRLPRRSHADRGGPPPRGAAGGLKVFCRGFTLGSAEVAGVKSTHLDVVDAGHRGRQFFAALGASIVGMKDCPYVGTIRPAPVQTDGASAWGRSGRLGIIIASKQRCTNAAPGVARYQYRSQSEG